MGSNDKTCDELMQSPTITITNRLDNEIELFWVNPDGEDSSVGNILPNEWTSLETTVEHHFYARNWKLEEEIASQIWIQDSKRKYYDIWESEKGNEKYECDCDEMDKLQRENDKLKSMLSKCTEQ